MEILKKFNKEKQLSIYNMTKAGQFLDTALENEKKREQYSIVLNNYYEQMKEIQNKWAPMLLAGISALGITTGFAIHNFNLIPTLIGGTLGAGLLATYYALSAKDSNNMEECIELSKTNYTDKEHKPRYFYVEGKDNTLEYLGKLKFKEFEKVYKKLDDKHNMTGVAMNYAQKLDDYLENEKRKKEEREFQEKQEKANKFRVKLKREFENLSK